MRPGEGRNTATAFVTLFCVTAGHTLVETARDALFLSRVPATRLPIVYLAIVVLALLLSQIRPRRAGGAYESVAVLVGGAAVTLGFFPLARAGGAWVLYALYVWSGVFGAWFAVRFWTLLGRAHTVTQAKRLYGLIGGGGVSGAVVGALAARWMMGHLSARWALLAGAVAIAAAAVPAGLVRVPQEATEPAEATRTAPEPEARSLVASLRVLLASPFARRVLAVVLVSTMTLTLGDYVFKGVVASRVPAAELGRYFSTFYAVTNALALFAQIALAPAILRRWGVQRALLVFPLLVVASALGFIAAGGAILGALVLKGTDGALKHSLHRTTNELLLVPIPDGTRERVKPIIDLVGGRGGSALASVSILAVAAIGVDPARTAWGVAALAAGWLALVFTMRGLYLDVFRETLRTGGLTGKAELPPLDLGVLEALMGALNSPHDADVLAALELLGEQHKERLIPALILFHPSKDVVLRALEVFTRMGRTEFVAIADRLDGHPDRQIAAAALRARTAVSPSRKLLERRLAGPCASVGVTALVGLVSNGWTSAAAAKERLGPVFTEAPPEARAELARAIAAVPRAPEERDDVASLFDDLVIKLAADRDLAVRQAAVDAMGARPNERFVPVLLEMLRDHELRAKAREALVQMPRALEKLTEALTMAPLARQIRVHLPRTIALLEPRRAADVLTKRLPEESDGAVRFKILRGLYRLRAREPGLALDERLLGRVASDTLDHIEELERWRLALARDESEIDAPPPSAVLGDPLRAVHHLLGELVRDKQVHATQRLFMLFSLIYREDFEDVRRGLASRDRKRRARGLELLENLLSGAHKARALAVLGDRPATEPAPYDVALAEILARAGGTLRTLAEFRAAELGLELEARQTEPPPEERTLGQLLREKVVDGLIDATKEAARAPA